MTDRPSILCIMRIPPFPSGHGGSQRAWLLVNALARIGTVHFVLVHRPSDRDLDSVSLEPLRALVETMTVIPIPAWDSIKSRHGRIPWRIARWIDQALTGSGEAPRLPRGALAAIAARLPQQRFDILFAGRLPSAVIADQLIAQDLLQVDRRFVDFDDVMSAFKRRQLATGEGSREDRILQRLDIGAVERAERKIGGWDAISLCTDKDVVALTAVLPGAHFVKVPNVVDRALLAPPGDAANLLFVGNLSFPPNEHGLRRFVDEAWPRIVAARPDARFDVVGLRPSAALQALLTDRGIALHADVPSVEPFYRDCAIVVCPIFFGGGTRIKLLEAMAYGRPTVSTTIGAEGLGMRSGEHGLIADDMGDFADAAIRLLDDRDFALRLAANGRALQQTAFSPAVIDAAVADMVGVGDVHDAAN